MHDPAVTNDRSDRRPAQLLHCAPRHVRSHVLDLLQTLLGGPQSTTPTPRNLRDLAPAPPSPSSALWRMKGAPLAPRALARKARPRRQALGTQTETPFRPRHLLCEPRGQDTRVLGGVFGGRTENPGAALTIEDERT
jgi:hypothetical protein